MSIHVVQRRCGYSVLIWLLALTVHAMAAENPAQLFERVKAATGGSAWDRITSKHEVFSLSQGAVSGAGEAFGDVSTGRYFSKFTMGSYSQSEGWDGQENWDLSGDQTGAKPQTDVMREVYQTQLAYFFPERHPAKMQLLRHQKRNGQDYAIVHIVPEGADPFDYWINTHTWRIERLQELLFDAYTVTLDFSDFRTVEGVTEPFVAHQMITPVKKKKASSAKADLPAPSDRQPS